MINLSYIIATRNRLPFLRITLQHLINAIQPYEEIVVVDGNSTDGTKEYLQQLFNEGKIHQFISEPDRNQADAWNKAMLMAKGEVLKKVMDDDVFDYTAIRTCCDFMIQHPQMDVCLSNSLNSNVLTPNTIWFESRLPWFKNWRDGNTQSFTFSDMHMLIRKSALSYIGLYDTQFVMIDWEYSLRISYLKCKIAFYTGYNAMAVSTPSNITSTATEKLYKTEGEIGKLKYNYAGDDAEISAYSKLKIKVGTFLHARKEKGAALKMLPAANDLELIYDEYYRKLRLHNEGLQPEFIL